MRRLDLAFSIALIVAAGLAIGAAPRAAHVIPAVRVDAPASVRGNVEPDLGLLGAPHGVDSVPPRSQAAAPLVHGIASYVGPRYGSRYLALPGGPGLRVRVCSASKCLMRTSTDAGPALFLQRQGRVADLSRADFRTLCGCRPELVGLIHVTVAYAAPKLPETDTAIASP